MFKLKEYQDTALQRLRGYLRGVAVSKDADTTFYQVTREIWGRGIPYQPVREMDHGMPYVCLRMPTGAGKTFVASHAVAIATRDYLEADRSVVLWLVPTTAILDQTLAALTARSHPYRQALTDALGRIEVLRVKQALDLNRATLNTATTIIVATMQSFRVEDTEGRKVYDDAGSLMDHFSGLPDELLVGLERYENGRPKYSLANVLRLNRPIVIVDEAHNARTPLSFDTLARFAPSCIIELTATPAPDSNVLHSVSAAQLKAEDMIKLPIELTTKGEWKPLLTDAVAQRDRLERVAREEKEATGEYIRPILLIQADANRGYQPITPEVVKRTLEEDFRIPSEQIAIATGDHDDLAGVEDILSPSCAFRYIITVQKLGEGWDYPFAYVLCSITGMRSSKAIEQIVGRILRMPRARKKQHEELNRAYAFAATSAFGEALNALKDVLVENGFERQEVDTLIKAAPAVRSDPFEGLPLFQPNVRVEITVNEAPKLYELPAETRGKVKFDAERNILTIHGELSEDDRSALRDAFTSSEMKEAVDHAFQQVQVKTGMRIPAPVEKGISFSVPKLLIRQGELLEEFEESHILERGWRLSSYEATLPSFDPAAEEAQHAIVDVTEAGKIQPRFVETLHRQMILLADEHGWTIARLVNWLDRSFPHPDLTSEDTGIFLTRLVHHLIDARGLDLDQLVHYKYALRRKIEARINEYRKQARQQTAQMLFDTTLGDGELTVDPARVFTYPKEYPYSAIYDRGYPFTKHYYPLVSANSGF